MLDYKLTKDTPDQAEYEFYVEGDKGQVGHVILDKETGVCQLLEEDPTYEQKRYGGKLMSSIERQLRENSAVRESGTVMWY